MTKEYRFTTSDIVPLSDMDCVLSPDDPIKEIQRMQFLGGSQGTEKCDPCDGSNISKTAAEKSEIMKQHDIQPGTPSWFRLWFSLPYLTGETPVDKKD